MDIERIAADIEEFHKDLINLYGESIYFQLSVDLKEGVWDVRMGISNRHIFEKSRHKSLNQAFTTALKKIEMEVDRQQ